MKGIFDPIMKRVNALDVKLTFYEVVTVLFVAYLSFALFGRSIFFILATEQDIDKSTWYQALNSYASLELWGIIPLISSVLLFMSIFSKSEGAYISFVIGNVIAFTVYYMFSVTGVDHGINWMTPYNNVLLTCFHLALAALGGFKLWKIKKTNT